MKNGIVLSLVGILLLNVLQGWAATPGPGLECFNASTGTLRMVTPTEIKIERGGIQHSVLIVPATSVRERWIGPRPRLLIETPDAVMGLYSASGALGVIESSVQRAWLAGMSDSDAASKFVDRSIARNFAEDRTFPFRDLVTASGMNVLLNSQPMPVPDLRTLAPNGNGFGLQIAVKSHGVDAEFRFSNSLQLRAAILNGRPMPLFLMGFEKPEDIATKSFWGSAYSTTVPGFRSQASFTNGAQGAMHEYRAVARSSEVHNRPPAVMRTTGGLQLYIDELNLLWLGAQPEQICVFKDRIYGVYKAGKGRFRVVDNSRTISGIYSSGAELESLRNSLIAGRISGGRSFEIELREHGKPVGADREASLGILEVSEPGIVLPVGVAEGVGILTVDPVKRSVKLTGLVGKYTAAVVDEK